MASSSQTARRVRIDRDPFRERDDVADWLARDRWPARWIGPPTGTASPWVAAFGLRFTLQRADTVRIHVSADERYALCFDGERVGRGPECGDRLNWFFETYDLNLTAGEHVLAARVWALGPGLRPLAHVGQQSGFLLAAEAPHGPLLSTGTADWQVRPLSGYRFRTSELAWGVGAFAEVDAAAVDWAYRGEPTEHWTQPTDLGPAMGGERYHAVSVPLHPLKPAPLPAAVSMPRQVGRVRHVESLDALEGKAPPVEPAWHRSQEAGDWQAMLDGCGSVTVPAGATRRVIVDLEAYLCAYPFLTVRCGANGRVALDWAEALYEQPPTDSIARSPKGHRDEIAGKFFVGVGDVFHTDGERRVLDTLRWRAGRYLALTIVTDAEPLTIESLMLEGTRYPLELESRFACDDGRLAVIEPIMVRAMQMCSHETYMDCPFFEQLMYVGDSRLEALTHYVMQRDDALPCKSVAMFEQSRLPSGLTQSRYPCEAMQVIPGFSLWWVGMVHDLAMWRDRGELIRRMLPGVRAVLWAFADRLRADGLFDPPNGWMFLDWCDRWPRGVPPTAAEAPTASYHWQLVDALHRAAELERWFGCDELAAGHSRWAGQLAEATHRAFFNESRGLYAEDLAHQHFSEHAQCLALLSGGAPAPVRPRLSRGLLTDAELTRTTIYFTHYLFEAYRLIGAIDALFERLGEWFDLPALGLLTTREKPEPTRSDCHAWGAHPLYHQYATILGIRPAGFGFRSVRIEPQPGPLTAARGELVHPQGTIEVDLTRREGHWSGHVTLPPGVDGTLHLPGTAIVLTEGVQRFSHPT